MTTTYNHDLTLGTTRCADCYAELLEPNKIGTLSALQCDIKHEIDSLLNNNQMIADGKEAPFWSRHESIKNSKAKLIALSSKLIETIESLDK